MQLQWKRSVLLAMVISAAGCNLTPKQQQSNYSPTGLLQRTGDSVGSALHIEPKVVKAIDPTSLQYDAGPVKPSLHLSAAAVMEQNGQLDEARKHYEQVLKAEPSNRSALIGVARLYHRQGDTNAAIQAYRRAAQSAGNDPVILNDLALCLARADRTDEAIENLRSAMAMKPDSLLYRNNLAAILVQSNRADDAVSVLAETHGAAVAHYNVGYLLNQHGEPAAASAHFVRSLQADPSFEPAQTMLDRVVPQVGRRPERDLTGRPDLSAAGVTPPSTMAVESAGAPGRSVVATVAGPTANKSLATNVATVPEDTHVQPAQFAESPADMSSIASQPDIDLSQLPPIRLPLTNRARRPTTETGGFIAPAPVNQ
jgi:Flp pilus assembly protein TadD